MGERKELSALTRIEQFNDNKIEQVWELFKNEFRNASRQVDGELGWMLVTGALGPPMKIMLPYIRTTDTR